MANYAMHTYEVYAEKETINEIEKEVQGWEGNIESKRINDKKLEFSYPMKYIHDCKTLSELTDDYKDAEIHLYIVMEEGFEALYVARNGMISSVDIDKIKKDTLNIVLSEIDHRNLYNKKIFKSVIGFLEDDDIPWFDATLRFLMAPGLLERVQEIAPAS